MLNKVTILFISFILTVSNLTFGQNYNEQSKNIKYTIITDITAVPNTKRSDNLNVSDPHNMINSSAEGKINAIAKELHTAKDYEVMVVCLNSIGSNNPRKWGVDLFNLWAIGDKETENGLLILVINDVHRIEFITGRGLESVLTDAESYNIQQQYMIPEFKKNDYSKGILKGMEALSELLMKKERLYDSNPADVYSAARNATNERKVINNPLLRFYFGLTVLTTLIYFSFLFFSLGHKDLYKRYRIMKVFGLLIFAFIIPIPFIALVFWTRKLMENWRNTERISFKSGDLMHKLSEAEEDEFLNAGQIAEEVLKSVDYDVWINVDATDVLILAYKPWFSQYNQCSNCGFTTYYKVYDKIIVQATYSTSGKGEKKYECSNCGHKKINSYKIPRKQRTRNTGALIGGGFLGGGGSGRSFGGGGSFGGGSFGGGSSRGGGSGSSW